ncbi:MAG: ATP-binding cassette domain-containing protein [Thermodesulfobacteriota bacterium]
MVLLAIKNLTIGDNEPLALKLTGGETIMVSGPSGCGKSRLLRAIADLDPHDGTILLNEKRQEDIAPWLWRRQVGLLPAENFWWHDRVGDNFEQKEQLLHKRLKNLDLSPAILEKSIIHLSSGERQRLALIRLLQMTPSLLLLDEPTANLDDSNTRRMEKLITDYQLEQRCAIIWISHDPAQQQRLAKRHYRFQSQHFLESNELQ